MKAFFATAVLAFGAIVGSAANAAPVLWEWVPGKEPSQVRPKSTLASLPRSLADRPDDVSGAQIHVMYVLPFDGLDEQLDTNGKIGTSVVSFNLWLLDQTPGRWLRIDTYQGLPDITFVRLSRTDSQLRAAGIFLRDEIESELRTNNLIDDSKIYAVYYGGSSDSSCGGGAWPPVLNGNVGAMYLKGEPPGAPACATNPLGASLEAPGYLDIAMLHEVMHTHGFVPTCAPHEHLGGHVSDSPNDLMWAGNAPWQLPPRLDIGHDDYYEAGIAGCLDLASSPFLESTSTTASSDGTIVFNPYGPISVQGGTLVGNTISNLQQNATIQLGSIPGAAGSYLEIDFDRFGLESGRTLTFVSGAAGQTVLLRVTGAAGSAIDGIVLAQGTGNIKPPKLYLKNPGGFDLSPGGNIIALAGLTLDALGTTTGTGQQLLNDGILNGGSSLTLLAGAVNGGGPSWPTASSFRSCATRTIPSMERISFPMACNFFHIAQAMSCCRSIITVQRLNSSI